MRIGALVCIPVFVWAGLAFGSLLTEPGQEAGTVISVQVQTGQLFQVDGRTLTMDEFLDWVDRGGGPRKIHLDVAKTSELKASTLLKLIHELEDRRYEVCILTAATPEAGPDCGPEVVLDEKGRRIVVVRVDSEQKFLVDGSRVSVAEFLARKAADADHVTLEVNIECAIDEFTFFRMIRLLESMGCEVSVAPGSKFAYLDGICRRGVQ